MLRILTVFCLMWSISMTACQKSSDGGEEAPPVLPPAPPPVPVNASGLWEGKLSITDKGRYEHFIEEFLLICDRGWYLNFQTTPNGNFVDVEDCDTHKKDGYIAIYSLNKQQFWVSFSAGYHAIYPTFDLEREREFELNYFPINADAGFALAASDIYGGAVATQGINRFRIEIQTGKLDDSELTNVVLTYNGEEFAKASALKNFN